MAGARQRLGYLNGGIIATVLDCHRAAAVMAAAEARGLTPDGTLPYVTAGIRVRYRHACRAADRRRADQRG